MIDLSSCQPQTDGETIHSIDFLEDGTCVCACGGDPWIPEKYSGEESDDERFARALFVDFLLDAGEAFLDEDPKYIQKLEKAYDLYCSPSDSRDGVPLREMIEASVDSQARIKAFVRSITTQS
jgi:hypothetical protein